MNRDTSPHNLEELEYPYAINSILEGRDGEGLNISNEPSNLLCSQFKTGYKVIGFKNDINANRTYFFLTNPTTGSSEIGYIDGNHDVSLVEDTEVLCGCTYKNILAEPLQDQTQIETCVYNTLIQDDCNKCLNFNVGYPIQDIVLKDEKSGKHLYFTDNFNPPRYIDLDDIEQYKYFQDEQCDDPAVLNCEVDPDCVDCETCEDFCPDCSKMNIFKAFQKPCLQPATIINGGNLKQGRYYFLVAYCDQLGNELSEYYSLTQPVDIFNIYDNITDQTELAKETNYAIKLTLEDLDKKFDFYKIAVIQNATVLGDSSYFVEGIHSTSTNTVIYNTEDNKERITLEELLCGET